MRRPKRVAGFPIYINSDSVTGLRRILVPAKQGKCRRTAGFTGPMDQVAMICPHVELMMQWGWPTRTSHGGILRDHSLSEYAVLP